MSYKIEINADTLNELGGKLLALASQFHAAADPVMPEVKAAEAKPKRNTKAKTEEPVEDAGNAETAATEQAPAEHAVQTENTPDAPSEPAAPELDFDKDVAPVVIDAVGKIGKDGVTEILSQFGAARASEVSPAQWGELVDALKDKVA